MVEFRSLVSLTAFPVSFSGRALSGFGVFPSTIHCAKGATREASRQAGLFVCAVGGESSPAPLDLGRLLSFTIRPVCVKARLMDINDVFPSGLSVDRAFDLLSPVAIYILGMAVYAIFVFKYYRFVAARDMFAVDLSKYAASRFRWMRIFLHIVMYVAKYLVLFPFFAFFWFAVLTLILTFLSKDRSFPDVLLMALVTISSIRVTAYYNEDLSRDLAKILPFAVLAIFLIDTSFFAISKSLDMLKGTPDYTENILYYLLFLIAMEFVLRLAKAIVAFLVAVKVRLLGGRDQVTEDV